MAVTATQVQNLYLAYFGRPAEQAGLTYWTAQTSATVDQISAAFAQQTEYTTAYNGLTRTQTIDKLYQNLFGRSAASNELAYWNNSTDVSVSKLALALTNGATGTDRLTLDNKLQFAATVTNNAGTTASASDVTTGYTTQSVTVGANTYTSVGAYVAAVATATSGISQAQAAAQYYQLANTAAVAAVTPSINAASNGLTNVDFKGLTAGTIKLDGAQGTDATSLISTNKVTALTLNGTTSAADTTNLTEAAATKIVSALTVSVSSTNTGTVATDKVLTLGLTDLTALKTIDASASSVGISSDVSSLEALTSVKTGSGNDTITADTQVAAAANIGKAVALTVDTGAGNDAINLKLGHAALTVNAGDGNDTVTLTGTALANAAVLSHAMSITLGAGNDSLVVTGPLGNLATSAALTNTSTAAEKTAANTVLSDNAIKVTDFNGTQDTLTVSFASTSATAAGSFKALTAAQSGQVSQSATLAEALNAASLAAQDAAAGGNPAVNHSTAFQFGGNTYVYVDATGNGVSANDGLIELTGYTGALGSANFVATA